MNIKTVFAAAALCGLASVAFAAPSQAASLHWSGNVDDTATISVSGRDVHVNANKNGVRDVSSEFRGGDRLPARSVRVRLRETDGRGRVRLIQQPSARNNYTAVVRIVDNQPGQNHYDFILNWPEGGGRGRRGY